MSLRSEILFDDRTKLNEYNPSENTTVPFLTVYEKTEVLGTRMTQLSNGARSFLPDDQTKTLSVKEIASKELTQHKLPFVIIRTLPNGTREYWRLNDLIM